MFEDLELNPMAAGMGIVGAIIAVIVQSKVETNPIFTVLTFIATAIVCYFIAARMLN